MLYIFLAIGYFIIIYLLLIAVCVIIYSITVLLMVIGVEINKTFMCCFECVLEALFHPCSCLVETWLACYAMFCHRTPARVAEFPVVPPPKEIEMVVILNPGKIPLQIGSEAV